MEDFVSELSSARIEALKLLIYEAEEAILESEQNYLNQKSTFDNNIVISFNYTSTVETFSNQVILKFFIFMDIIILIRIIWFSVVKIF